MIAIELHHFRSTLARAQWRKLDVTEQSAGSSHHCSPSRQWHQLDVDDGV